MKHDIFSGKKIAAILMALVLVLGLAACGDKDSGPVPQGKFVCTQRDEGFGDGLEPVQADEFMTFNADGTGRWEYALDSPITWKLKGDKLTIVETV
ncbi:MAG TPA: lipocalin family protein, partial [Clostridia bacterium]|nr:lipocalin family protein [Clostridia bacterium]